jgi:hypothetical protein
VGVVVCRFFIEGINPLNAELNPICHLLTLLGAHPIFHISKIRVNKTIQYERQCISEHNIFPNDLIKDTIFGKNINKYKMCVLVFSTHFILNISHNKKSARYYHIRTSVFM